MEQNSSLNRKNVQVALILYDHMLATSVSLPVEMLRAGEAAGLQQNKNAPKLIIEMVAEHLKPVTTRALIKLFPDVEVKKASKPDFAFIPSLWRNPRPVLKRLPNLISWLDTIWHQGSTVIGGGTGVCFMAEAGILNARPATTHWHYVEQFKRDYPQVILKPDFFITQSDRIYCAASLNALADIIVHIIAQIYGKVAAQTVERNFSHEIRKPYEEQRYLEGAADRHSDELISQIQFWMQTNLSAETSLESIAEQFGISVRSLTRRFKQANGISAYKYWQQLRLEAAKELLTSTNLSIQEVAFHVGYQDQSHFTRLFKKNMASTPKDYRIIAKKKLFTAQ
ncbi:helix-turn-helix domain-containing protein [Thalassotalea sp. 1_MG-2023]|uniref:GlxA family transcriptional regulator n=1 Tax=Thalassotalea sp. 1_MG-2023 TaxID=3062680 RepID=UPI0026E47E46|nr:helix-turn-helix domain-containing protein [Thalassotalea sp. 1_MG-2023]MDO6428181.1 helix-turn-helix domain-containing protein [Thalassotalea sp. 1_MG-2023]